MRRHVRISLPRRTASAARPLPRAAAPIRKIVRSELAQPSRNTLASPPPAANWNGFQPDPYVDYGRFLTPEGGILFIHKDLDLRLRHTLWRIFAWTLSTGMEGW